MHLSLSSVAAVSLLAACAAQPVVALAIQEAPAASQASSEHRARNVAIVIYPDVELLDFAGPGEVFAQAGHAFNVYTVAASKEPILSMGFATVTPQYTFASCPKPDIVVVPGGSVPDGDETLRAWVLARSKEAELMMSVCNGALVYAAAGLLDGLEVTTHRSALQGVALRAPSARVYENRRFVDNGHVLTAAGIAAGIDGALHVVQRYCGDDVAWSVARNMEYDWRPDEIEKLHAQPGKAIDGSESLQLVSSIRKLGIDGALAEYKKLPDAAPEAKLNGWGYLLMRSQRVDDAVDLFRFTAAAFPTSANAMDSLSDALEVKSDAEGAKRAAKECLARLEKEKGRPEDNRKLLHNAAASRIARLSGASASDLRFVCAPCNGPCDRLAFVEGGPCPDCHMQLVERSN